MSHLYLYQHSCGAELTCVITGIVPVIECRLAAAIRLPIYPPRSVVRRGHGARRANPIFRVFYVSRYPAQRKKSRGRPETTDRPVFGPSRRRDTIARAAQPNIAALPYSNIQEVFPKSPSRLSLI